LSRSDNTDREPDIVLVILQLVLQRSPNFPPEQIREIEQLVREQYGGVRTRIAKRKKHPTAEQRRKIFQEALTDASTEQIVTSNGINRATLYRYLKRGGE
jgi:DNA invertase Pin-like site-specific DNA recombinase